MDCRHKMDTIMLKQWLRDVTVYQTELNNDETTNRAFVPEPIRLLTDESLSMPMLYMGKRESNFGKLEDLRMSASKEKRHRIDVVIDLYASAKIPSYTTAVNMVLRLVDKTKRKDQIAKTDKEFAILVRKINSADSLK